MPTYQYQCTECGEGLEAVQKFTDDALTVCPSCDGRLKKVFSAVGIVFKGSGFYRNDSRGSSSSSTPAVGGLEVVRLRVVLVVGFGHEGERIVVVLFVRLLLVVGLRAGFVERYVGRLAHVRPTCFLTGPRRGHSAGSGRSSWETLLRIR